MKLSRYLIIALLLAGCDGGGGRVYEDEAAPLNLSIVPNPEERLAQAASASAAAAGSDADADACAGEDCDANAEDADKTEASAKANDKKNGKDKKDAKKPAETPVVSNYARISALCPRVAGEIRTMHVEEPTLVANYDLETLGVIRVQVTEGTMNDCLTAAIEDGAEVLSRSPEMLELFYPTRLEYFFDEARARIDHDAIEGRWSDSQKRIIPGVSGRKLDVDASRKSFFEALKSGRDSFELVIVPEPAFSTDISSVADFKPSVLIGEYKTQFSKKKNRTINVKLAASFMDGIFLMPGASFSYNAWVGERSEARGFKEAPVIENGEMVEGLGGGACQVSSTIHAAALMSGLERPVVLRLSIQDTTLIARFYSDQPKPFKVEFKSEVHEEIPFNEVVTVDPTLEEGTIKITRYGKPGYKMVRSRVFDENGKKRTERLLMDTYQSQTQQVSIAPDVVYPPP